MAEARIDKWLWASRIFKTRTIAAEACKKGRVSINGTQVKPSRMIKPGEVIQVKNTASSREARSLFCLPSSRLIELPAPLPKKKPSACITVMMENAMPMAPDCAVPS